MNKRNTNLLKNSIIFMIGNFSSKLLMFFLLPLYTNYLDPSEYGQVDIYINILSMLYCFVSLQAIEVVYRFIQDAKTEAQKSEVITNSFMIAVLGMAVYAVGMGIFGAVTHFQYTLVFILYVVCNIMAQFCQQTIRGMNRSALYSAVGVISTFVQVALNILFIVVCHYGSVSLLWSHVLTYLFIFIGILIKCNFFKYFRISTVRWSVMKEQLAYSLPLMPNALCVWGMSSLGRYLLLFFYTTTEVGLLAFATKFSQLLGVVNSIFFMAWQQSAISEYNAADKNEYATDIFNKYLTMQVSVSALLLPVIKFMTFTIMGESYREAWQFIPLFFVGIILTGCANFVSMGFYGAKKTNTVFVASFISIAVYFAIGYFGAKYWYIWGVGVAYAVSQLVYFLIMQIRVKQYLYAKIHFKGLLGPLLLAVVSVVCFYLIDSLWIMAVVAVVFGVACLYFNRQLCKKLLGTVFGKLKGKHAEHSEK